MIQDPNRKLSQSNIANACKLITIVTQAANESRSESTSVKGPSFWVNCVGSRWDFGKNVSFIPIHATYRLIYIQRFCNTRLDMQVHARILCFTHLIK